MRTKASRKQAGLKAKKVGDSFESAFGKQCQTYNVAHTHFPIGAKRVGPKRLIQIPTPWDWVLTFQGRSLFVDTKTQAGKTFPLSKLERHQVEELFKHELGGALAGYVVWTREDDRVIFIRASIMIDLLEQRGSLTFKSPGVVYLGSKDTFDPRNIFLASARSPMQSWMDKELRDERSSQSHA